MLFPIFLLVFDAALCAGDVTVQVNGFYSSRLEVVSLSGHFASIGASSNAEGDAVEVRRLYRTSSYDSASRSVLQLPASCSSDKSTTPRLHPHGWIAVVDSTRSSEDNETKSCTFLSQVQYVRTRLFDVDFCRLRAGSASFSVGSRCRRFSCRRQSIKRGVLNSSCVLIFI